ncbi:hypothetical protein BH09DEP1_BH09DEP1_3280 [soil metagenome]
MKLLPLLAVGLLLSFVDAQGMIELLRDIEQAKLEDRIKRRAFHEKVLIDVPYQATFDEIAYEHCQKNLKARMAIIWPRANRKAAVMKQMLAACGPILHEKKFKLFNQGPLAVFKTAQPKETDENAAKWIRDYVPAHLHMPYRFRAILFETDKPLDEIVAVKKKIREYAGFEWCSIHIDDSHEESLGLAKLVFNHNPDALFDVLTEKLNRYAQWACLRDSYALQTPVQVAREYSAKGGDLNKKTAHGFSLLHMAADKADDGLIETLCENGAEVDIGSANGDTPLMMAAQAGHLSTVITLLKQGAVINKQNTIDEAALSHACLHGHTAVVKHLLQAGANVNQKDSTGWTALDEVSFCDNLSEKQAIVQILKDAGGVLGTEL